MSVLIWTAHSCANYARAFQFIDMEIDVDRGTMEGILIN